VRGSDKPSIVVNGVVCLNGQSCQLINGVVGFGTGRNEEKHSTKTTFSNGVAGLRRKSRRKLNSTTVMADDVM